MLRDWMRSKVPSGARKQIRRIRRSLVRPKIGSIEYGDLRRLLPISEQWGWNRGLPIDRHYIEQFLKRHSSEIRGRVLEFGDNEYTTRFGESRVVQSDVLDVRTENRKATWHTDLVKAEEIPSNFYDCIICTQTLPLIYELRKAIQTLYRILTPGGVLLVTLPGITKNKDSQYGNFVWSFTPFSAEKMFGEIFPEVSVEAFGNVLTAVSFLHGIAAEELTGEELEFRDPGFDVSIVVHAVKPQQKP